MKLGRILSVFCLIALLVFSGCSADKAEFETLDDFKNSTLGVVTGSLYDGYSRELFPESQIKYHKNFADVLLCIVNRCEPFFTKRK